MKQRWVGRFVALGLVGLMLVTGLGVLEATPTTAGGTRGNGISMTQALTITPPLPNGAFVLALTYSGTVSTETFAASSSPALTWTQEETAQTTALGGHGYSVWVALNASMSTYTIDANASVSTNLQAAAVWVGNVTTVDAVGANSGSSATASATATTTVAGDMLVLSPSWGGVGALGGGTWSFSAPAAMDSPAGVPATSGSGSTEHWVDVVNGHVLDAFTGAYQVNATLSQTQNWYAAIVALKAASPPAAPTGLFASLITSTTLKLTWSDGPGPITGERVQEASFAGGACGVYSTLVTTTSRTQAYTVTGLTPQTPYCFRVAATNTTGFGAYASISDVVTTGLVGTVSFVVAPIVPDAGTAAQFVSQVADPFPPFTYAWAFGDGGTSTSASPTHSYASAGTYGTWLNVTDALGTVLHTSTNVAVHAAPSATAAVSPASPTAESSATFTPTLSGGAPPYEASWVFGDGTTSAVVAPQHVYARAGTYSVYGNFTDADGVTFSVAKSVVVGAASLSASFTYSPTSPEAGLATTFAGSTTGGVAPFSYGWTFGDGSGSVGLTTSHNFSTAGTFTTTFAFADAFGATAQASQSITVVAGLSVSGAANLSTPDTSETVWLNGTTSGGVAPFVYLWRFGDGGSASTLDAQHAWAMAGVYTLRLLVIDADGALSMATFTVDVKAPLAAAFSIGPASPATGMQATLTSQVVGGRPSYVYLWTFGDGHTATSIDAVHAWTALGNYTVSLKVTDANGLSSTFSRTVTVVAPSSGSSTTTVTSSSTDLVPYALVLGLVAVGGALAYRARSSRRRYSSYPQR